MEKKTWNPPHLRPVQILAGSFALLIITGAILLYLPFSQTDGTRTGFLDCLFTSTSAVCVTGLVVVDTSAVWTRAGQVVILLLIQFGGIGIVSFGALFALLLGQKINFRQRQLVQEQFGQSTVVSLFQLLPVIAGTTIVIEFLGALILAPGFIKDHGLSDGAWHSVFHSISAFCNAGFSTFPNNLESYTGNFIVNAVICSLIVLGGLGFPVIAELLDRKHGRRRMSLHARVVLTATAILIAAGAVLIFLVETFFNPEFTAMPLGSRVLGSIFQSVTARTAGYNTLAIGRMAPASLLVLLVLMFVGGSPSGTAGGIKTTTLVSALAAIKASLQGSVETNLMGRRLSRYTSRKALVLILLAAMLILAALFMMLLTGKNEGSDVLALSFELVSAFGTVGLSTGITPDLMPFQKVIVLSLMYIGRLGPMTFALALASPRVEQVKYPETELLIG